MNLDCAKMIVVLYGTCVLLRTELWQRLGASKEGYEEYLESTQLRGFNRDAATEEESELDKFYHGMQRITRLRLGERASERARERARERERASERERERERERTMVNKVAEV